MIANGVRVEMEKIGSGKPFSLFPMSRHHEIHERISHHNRDAQIGTELPPYVPHVMVVTLDAAGTLMARVDASKPHETTVRYFRCGPNAPIKQIDTERIVSRAGETIAVPNVTRPRLKAWRNTDTLIHYTVTQRV